MRRRWSRSAALLVPLVGTLYACFSERASPTAQLEGACSVGIGSGAVGSVGAIVAIRGFAFHPAELKVPPGTRVTWVNCEDPDEPPHTSTSDAEGWSSPLLRPGESFTHTFEEPGEFGYHCAPHPFMEARVVVE